MFKLLSYIFLTKEMRELAKLSKENNCTFKASVNDSGGYCMTRVDH